MASNNATSEFPQLETNNLILPTYLQSLSL